MEQVLEDQSIDLTVTSPPYDNLRDYNGYEFDFELIAKQLYRVTKIGGAVVWVVGDATINGSETGTSFRQALGFMGIGFKLHDTMIWHKNTMPLNHNRYEQSFEYMFVFSREPPDKPNLLTQPVSDWLKERRKTKHITPMHRHTNGQHKIASLAASETRVKDNVWYIKVGYSTTEDKYIFNHPAIFPEALARDHIISWSNPGDLILDPMIGSGTTLKMAQQLGRQAVGIEISEEYCQIAVDRLRQPSFFSLPLREEKEELQQATLDTIREIYVRS